MKALQIECSSYEWWGSDCWRSAEPYSFDTKVLDDTHGLANAPATVVLLAPDATEAVQLLRALALHLERNPGLFAPLNEPGSSPDNPAPAGEGEVPF